MIVPRGVERRPTAPEAVHVVLMERVPALDTGHLRERRTVAAERI